MKEFLNTIRKPISSPVSKRILYSALVLIVGIALGIIAKILDETPSNSFPPFIEILDLRNFFSRIGFWLFSGICISIYSKTPLRAAINILLFFAGMVSSYYIYTVKVAGFFPKSYMMIWIAITILSPFIGAVCWYAKGIHPVSLCISVMILMIMTRQAFVFGFWYFDVCYALELLLWVLTLAVLYKKPKQIMVVSGVGILLFFITSPLNLFWGIL
ncbi:hypothetical protein [Anaerovorax odorimutans]|uniref:hypothetical protein n=1 Tax=Anaerovorax odorimutans TaxID=109327 RepID=UPI0003FD0196|nr:hypothetical protein [Anaerovorax odorimutans]